MNSTHKVEVVPITLKPHPNADKLSIVRIWNYTVCVRTTDWEGVNIGAYIPPDSVVPSIEAYAFLSPTGKLEDLRDKDRRIKCKRLRSVMSMGMLVPAPEGSKIGDDVADILQISHYVPSVKGESETTKGIDCISPEIPTPKYDLESWFKYSDIFKDGEYIRITEKIHGANARFIYCRPSRGKEIRIPFTNRKFTVPFTRRKKLFVGSRNRWLENTPNYWNQAVVDNPWIAALCKNYPGYVFYGEIFGSVQDLKYGTDLDTPVKGKIRLALFDVHNGLSFLPEDFLSDLLFDFFIKRVDLSSTNVITPILYEGPYSKEIVEELISGRSELKFADNIREGIVIESLEEQYHIEIGRKKLKAVSPDYLERSQ